MTERTEKRAGGADFSLLGANVQYIRSRTWDDERNLLVARYASQLSAICIGMVSRFVPETDGRAEMRRLISSLEVLAMADGIRTDIVSLAGQSEHIRKLVEDHIGSLGRREEDGCTGKA